MRKISKPKLLKKKKSNKLRGKKYQELLIRKITHSEKIMYNALNDAGILFEPQKIFYSHEKLYIADFYLPRFNKNRNRGLIIEIDGTSHNSAKAKEYDSARTKWLWKEKNVYVMRYTNEEVFFDIDEIIDEIIDKGVIMQEYKTSITGYEL